MKTIDSLVHKLSDQVIAPYSLRLFSLLVYLWFLINVFMLWNVKELLWGADNVFFRQGQSDRLIQNFFYQLIYDPSRFEVVFTLHVVSAVLSLTEKKWTIIPRIVAWMTCWMLFYSAVEAFNSGMMIMIAFAFYCSIVYTKQASPYRNVMTNIARYACVIQLSLVYFVAAVYKLSGEQWLAGDAIYYTMHINHFSSPMWIDSWMVHSQLLMKTLNYFALIYQIIFPIMIWVKKGRTWFLVIGILFHLFIGIFMHLWDFALAMIFAYSLFIPEEVAKKVLIFRTLR